MTVLFLLPPFTALSTAPHFRIQAHDNEIRHFVKACVDKPGKLQVHMKQSPSLEEDIISSVLQRVSGMQARQRCFTERGMLLTRHLRFLLTRFHVELLCQKTSIQDIYDAFKDLPKELDHAYDQLFARIRVGVEEYAALTRKILTLVSNAFRPLRVSEVIDAMAVERSGKNLNVAARPAVEFFESVCCGLISIGDKSKMIGLVHASAQ